VTEPREPMTREELMKISPAMAMAENLIGSDDPEGALAALFGTPGPDGKRPDVVFDATGSDLVDRLRRSTGTQQILKDDPMFPDRPQHPDFWDLVEVVLRQDEKADGGLPLEEAMQGFDYESVRYMAQQRAQTFLQMAQPDSDQALLMTSMWLDGFVAGQQIGRARPEISLRDASHRTGQR
jgi:hypothetical protein